MNYTKRLSAPSESNKYYISCYEGGYNRCIEIYKGSCLPNCVGYAWGRWYEIMKKAPSLSRANAENWFGYTQDGYTRGQTPKKGAVICWRKGQVGNESDGAGHVAVVEKIYSDGSILTSNSMYGGTRFYTQRLYPPLYQLNSKSYVFQGFIYLPDEPKEDEPKKESIPEKTAYTAGNYIVTAECLNVRRGAGTDYARVYFHELTPGAQKQVVACAGWKADGYVKGVEFTALETDGNWGKTPSGWVCLDYCKKI